MTNNEIFEAIDQLQYVLDKHAKSGVYQFANQDDIKLLEKVYNHITKRQYIKFNAGCSSCIKESFLILNNWKKRELKKMEAEEPTEVKSVFAPNFDKPKNENGENVIVNFSDENTIVEDVLNDVIQVYTDNADTIEPEASAENLELFNAEIAEKLDEVITSMKEAEEVKAEEPKPIIKPKSNGRGKRK